VVDVLLVGGGGREHVLAWKLAQSPSLGHLLIAPGNPGTAAHGQNIPVAADDIASLVALARQARVGLVVVGPELPLARGLADACLADGIAVFGPTESAARIESSKQFAKQLMVDANIPTAAYASFDDPERASGFVREQGRPWVVKADGLAAGKGVVVADTLDATLQAIAAHARSGSGQALLLEERLFGPEVSLLAFCDGARAVPLLAAQDHKRLRDGDKGPNTGGMGAFAPSPLLPPAQAARLSDLVIAPALAALEQRGTPFCGILYCGLMLTADGPRVLEYNARFGDPEAQALLPLLEGDLLDIMLACTRGELHPELVRWRDGAAACVVLAAHGYPEATRLGDAISGVPNQQAADLLVFQAGTALHGERLVTAGGRVLGVTGVGTSLSDAVAGAYAGVATVSFADMHYRRDIGASALTQHDDAQHH
jgi:phosphoribosylamine---glycine ligase